MLREQWDRFFESLWDKIRRSRQRSTKQVPPSESLPPPWGLWELDPKFFTALSKWTLSHPDSSLDRVLDRICVGIDKGKPLLELVPDSPFPARGLIGALAHLVKLGATISKATRDVQAFAKGIVHWVSEVKLAFEQSRGGSFTSKTCRNLAEMRDLVDEICKWATARLEDGRWSRMVHGLSITAEIEEFQSRIDKARAIFMDLSIVNLSQGHDAVLRNMRKNMQSVRDLIMLIQQTQAQQMSEILDELKSQKEADAQDKQAEARDRFLSQVLSTHIAGNTAYNEQGKRPCDAGTRIDILADIKEWVYDISDGTQAFLWLTGDPGCGKSAITASIARECKDSGVLWAQFFINRNIAGTTNPASYFPSIARQLADHSAIVANSIHNALRAQPSLMDDISQPQAGRLFVDSLKVASSVDPLKPVVVIIDGLDETDRARLHYTADIFSKALRDLPSNVKVFISSRTEDDIRKPFSAIFHTKHVKHIHLETSADSSIQDVSLYLARKIGEIVNKNDLDWLKWPGEARMRGLCERASGLFIWAVTVTKFIQDQLEEWGRECLDDVLNELSKKGMGDINVLYGTILRLAYRNQIDSWAFVKFRRIVGCIVVLRTPLCISDIQSLLSIRRTKTAPPADIEHFVRQLRTILVAGADAIHGRTVPRLHKSFFEFITSEHAHDRFRIDIAVSNGEVAFQCLHQLANLTPSHSDVVNKDWGHRSSANWPDCFPGPLNYACRFWISHLPQTNSEGAIAGVAVMAPNHADHTELRDWPLKWTQQFANAHNHDRPSSVQVAFVPSTKRVLSCSGGAIRVWDAESGGLVDLNSSILTHSGDVNSVAVSADGGRIVSSSTDAVQLWDAQSGCKTPLSFILDDDQVEGSSKIEWVTSVAISPDGKQVLSGSSDGALRLCDAQSGQAIGSPFVGHTASVTSVAFSADGKKVISAERDKTLRLWDPKNRQLVGSIFQNGPNFARSVMFSPDGEHVLSNTELDSKIWNIRSMQCKVLEGAKGVKRVSVAYFPDGKQLILCDELGEFHIWDISGNKPIVVRKFSTGYHVVAMAVSPDATLIVTSRHGGVALWVIDATSGKAVRCWRMGHSGPVKSVAFTPDGKRIVSGSVDGTVRLWDAASGRLGYPAFKGHTDALTCIALSPDGKVLASSSLDNTIWIWNMQTGLAKGSPINHGVYQVFSLAFSPDGCQIATLSLNNVVCLWDLESRELLASYRKEHINIQTSMSFSPDCATITASSIDGTFQIWDAIGGHTIKVSIMYDLPISGYSEVMSLDKEWRWSRGELDGALMRWYSVDISDFGVWAFVNGKVIRTDRTGLTTVDNAYRRV